MPLIRYRMDDVLIPDPSARSPYPYTRIKEIIGRQEDALVFTNDLGQDDFIHPIIIAELIIPGVTAWQIVLQSKTAFCFRARFDAALTPSQKEDAYAAIRRRLTGILAEKRMHHVHFEIDEVDALQIDLKTGKFRLVEREPDYAMTVP
jgi:phenylacetate-coenzyme A ligase PaaK-like adenylate-forming protein